MGAAPGVHGGQMGVASITVADEDPGEVRQHPASVDVLGAPAPDVHHGQVLGAGDVDIGQGPGGAAGGLVGMEHRRGAQQLAQPGQERLLQFPRRPAPDSGQEPGGHLDPGQGLQQRPRAAHRQVMPTAQQRGSGQSVRADPHR